MTLAKRSVKNKSNTFVVAGDCHPQTIEVVQTRAKPLGIEVRLANSAQEWNQALDGDYFAVLVQYPATSGRIDDLRADADRVHTKQAAFIVAADLLALTLLVPPGEVEPLRAALERLIRSPDLRETLGQAGYDRVRSLFEAENGIRKIAGLVRSTVR